MNLFLLMKTWLFTKFLFYQNLEPYGIKMNKKIGNFEMEIGIAEISHKTRRDRWGGNVNHKSLF